MKNPFKKALKKAQRAGNDAPRTTEEILKEYNELKLRLADSQYQVFVHTETVKELNYRMLQLNKEASHRQQLDKASKETK